MQDAITNAFTRSQSVQAAMVQFEQLHGPVKGHQSLENFAENKEPNMWVCHHCKEDWPCSKMETMMLIQGFATLQSMLPSGNMGALLSRFGGGPK